MAELIDHYPPTEQNADPGRVRRHHVSKAPARPGDGAAINRRTRRYGNPVKSLGTVTPVMTVAAIGRLVHHATILDFNAESHRRRAAAAATLKENIA